MKGQTQIAQIEFHYWKEDSYLHLKATDYVYQDLIGQEGLETMNNLMKSNEVTRLLLNYEKGFEAEILKADDRLHIYKEMQVPLNYRVAIFSNKKPGDVRYFEEVLKQSDYDVLWFTDIDRAKEWLTSK